MKRKNSNANEPLKKRARTRPKPRQTSILAYRGKKPIRERTTESKTVQRFESDGVVAIGLVLYDRAVCLAVEIGGAAIIIHKSQIKGCFYKRSLTKNLVEALVILFRDDHQVEKVCLALDVPHIELFDQPRIDSLISDTYRLEKALDVAYPKHPQENTGAAVSKYIQDVLEYKRVPYKRDFRLVKEKPAQTPVSYTVGNLPKVITAENVGALFDSFLAEYSAVNIFRQDFPYSDGSLPFGPRRHKVSGVAARVHIEAEKLYALAFGYTIPEKVLFPNSCPVGRGGSSWRCQLHRDAVSSSTKSIRIRKSLPFLVTRWPTHHNGL